MFLARVVGTVVATRKDPKLVGSRLLIVVPVDVNGDDEDGYHVALDTVDAGYRETVLCVRGSSARMAEGLADRPVDTAIIGIVDETHIDEGS